MRNLKLVTASESDMMDSLPTQKLVTVDYLSQTIYSWGTDGVTGYDNQGRKVHSIDPSELNLAPSGVEGPSLVGLIFLSDQQLLAIVTQRALLVYDPQTNEVNEVALFENAAISAEASPDMGALVVVTDKDTILLMNSEFDIVGEFDLHPTGFGKDEFITAGWGRKETQFHGTAGKEAAKAKAEVSVKASSYDDGSVRIVWRGDGQYFAISALCPNTGARIFRVWTRDGEHSSTCEMVDGMGHCFAWRPSGSLLASAQECTSGGHDIIFFERNGLRHGEFTLPKFLDNAQVVELGWNMDSSVLAIWLAHKQNSQSWLQLWTCNNYHWYLKQSLQFEDPGIGSFWWHAERPLSLQLLTGSGLCYSLDWDWSLDRSDTVKSGLDPSGVAVIHGASLLWTSFTHSVIPPPMCGQKLELDSPVDCITFGSNKDDTLRMLAAVGHHIGIFDCTWEAPNGRPAKCVLSAGKTLRLPSDIGKRSIYHLCSISDTLISFCVIGKPSTAYLGEISEDSDQLTVSQSWELDSRILLLKRASGDSVYAALEKGQIVRLKLGDPLPGGDDLSFPSAFHQLEIFTDDDGVDHFVQLSQRFQLYVDSGQICNNVSSVCLDGEFLLFTSLSHLLYCIPLTAVRSGLKLSDWECNSRTLERGCRLVTCVRGGTKVVLQLPRGNLETIQPRPLLLAVIRKHLNRCEYKSALQLMRKHRIDMNLIYDHDPQALLQNLESFVAAVGDVQLINLFIADLKNEDVTQILYQGYHGNSEPTKAAPISLAEKVNCLAERLQNTLEKSENRDQFLTSILTCCMKRTPSRGDIALETIKELRDNASRDNSGQVNDALQFLLNLETNVNALFDTALGTYDFDLVLMVAEKSQKDPKEYLPFLNDLKSYAVPFRYYKIDAHLKRHEKALTHIRDAGSEHWSEAVEFIQSNNLYQEALAVFQPDQDYPQQRKEIFSLYGDYMLARHCYGEAGILYERASALEKALEAYLKGANSAGCCRVMSLLAYANDQRSDVVYKLIPKLTEKGDFETAASLYLVYLNDVASAVQTLLKGYLWRKASQLIEEHELSMLRAGVFMQAMTSRALILQSSFDKRREEFERYAMRLNLVRQLKQQRYAEWTKTGGELEDLEACEVYSEVSTIASSGSASYSVTTAGGTRRARKKKPEHKRVSLKENSPYEDLALLKQLHEIATFTGQIQDDVTELAEVLIAYAADETALSLAQSFEALTRTITSARDTIWPTRLSLWQIPGPLTETLSSHGEDQIDVANLRGCSLPLDAVLIPPQVRTYTALNWFAKSNKTHPTT